jgi:hypothetical protein
MVDGRGYSNPIPGHERFVTGESATVGGCPKSDCREWLGETASGYEK